MKFMFITFIFFSSKVLGESKFPSWISYQKLSDEKYHYVVCSNDNENPERAKKMAELECLANIMKLSGSRTTSSEQIELSLNENRYESKVTSEGVEGNVRCEFTDMFTQSLESGYRVWLKCKIKKEDLVKYSKDNIYGEIAYGPKPLFDQIRKLETENKKLKEKEELIVFVDNGKPIKTSAEKLINKFVFNGMNVKQLMEKINPKYLIYSSGDMLCKDQFSSEEVFMLDESRICVSGIDGIVIGVCNSNNVCFSKGVRNE